MCLLVYISGHEDEIEDFMPTAGRSKIGLVQLARGDAHKNVQHNLGNLQAMILPFSMTLVPGESRRWIQNYCTLNDTRNIAIETSLLSFLK